jgi:hypothetical protein
MHTDVQLKCMEQSHKGGIYECCFKVTWLLLCHHTPPEPKPARTFQAVILRVTHKADAIARFHNILRHLQVFGYVWWSSATRILQASWRSRRPGQRHAKQPISRNALRYIHISNVCGLFLVSMAWRCLPFSMGKEPLTASLANTRQGRTFYSMFVLFVFWSFVNITLYYLYAATWRSEF